MCFYRWVNLSLFIFLFWVSLAQAKVTELVPLPAVISGTLKPLTIAVNGHIILQREDQTAEKLFINGREIKTNPGQHLAFYETSTDNILKVEEMISGQKSQVAIWVLPEIKKINDSGDEISVYVQLPKSENEKNLRNDQLQFDDQKIQIISEKVSLATFKNFTDQKKLQGNHELHILDSETKLERWYNFEFTPDPEPTIMKRLAAGVCDGLLGEDSAAFCLNYSYIWPTHYLLGLHINTQPFDKSGNNYGTSFSIGPRLGWQIFRKDNAPGSQVWFESGLQILQTEGTVHYQNYYFLQPGSNSTYSYHVSQTGFYIYLLTEPVKIDSILLQFSMMFGPRSNENVHNGSGSFSISYTW